jgi:hypothetical protein
MSVRLVNRAGEGHLEDYNRPAEKVSKTNRSGRSQAIGIAIHEAVKQWEQRKQKYYFPGFGVILSQRREKMLRQNC